MPSDIRSFFGAKGATSSQEKPVLRTEAKTTAPKANSRGKRKVLSDSENEDEQSVRKRSTPKKAITKRVIKQESPKGEETNASEYFASSNNRKPTPRENIEVRVPAVKQGSQTIELAKSTSKDTLKRKQHADVASSRSSTRISATKSYVEQKQEAESGDDVPNIIVDDDSAEDIYGTEFKRGGKQMEDEYESDEHGEEHVTTTRSRMKVNQSKATKGRKRKSVELSDDENEDTTRRAKQTPAKKPAAKKPKTPAREVDEPETKEMQDILDSIPQVRPPTPPARDSNKKFDFRANAARVQPAPISCSKEIPQGADNCLAGMTFVFTGILDALGREEGQELVKRYGGKVTTGPSSKTSYVVLGADAGPAKLATIQKFKLKAINEDGLFELIRRLPPNGGSSKAAAKAAEKQIADEEKVRQEAEKMEKEEKRLAAQQKKVEAAAVVSGKPVTAVKALSHELWTVKYAPTSIGQICGNKAQVEKLQNWLHNWRRNAKRGFKIAGADGSGLYRAAMLSGGPGIGKTTSAHLIAKLEGYDIVESNASDTRSKRLVETGLRGVLDTTSLLGYFAGNGEKVEAEKKKLVLIMDEVDGMSAGDRGGVGALAAICKKTNIPLILICNDRNLPKMKPFDGCTFPLKFNKPTLEQVRSKIMTILFREGMRDLIPKAAIDAIIEGSRADIRQIINMISAAKLDQQALGFDEGKKMASAWEKHVILRPWDIVQKILGGGMFAQSSKTSLNEKIELYFNDHEFSSLMLQENYLGTNPILAYQYSGKERTLKLLELTDRAAESISDGDLVDRMIHGSQQQWSLMPTHAVFSFVRPASFISGSMAGNSVRFTAFLGNLSKTGKLSRFVKDIQAHMRLRASADRHDVRQQYLPVLWQRLVKGLELHGEEPNGIDDIIKLMDSYFLTKDDWDAIYELGLGPQREECVSLSSSVKAAFTRRYNAASHPLPFMKAGGSVAPAKKTKEQPDLEEAIEESDDGEVLADPALEEDEELDLKKDKYVQAPKKKRKKASAASKRTVKKTKDVDDEEGEGEDNEEKVKSKERGRSKASTAKGKGKKERGHEDSSSHTCWKEVLYIAKSLTPHISSGDFVSLCPTEIKYPWSSHIKTCPPCRCQLDNKLSCIPGATNQGYNMAERSEQSRLQHYIADQTDSYLSRTLAAQSSLPNSRIHAYASYQGVPRRAHGTSMIQSGNPSLAALTTASTVTSDPSVTTSKALMASHLLEEDGIGALQLTPLREPPVFECPFNFLRCFDKFATVSSWLAHTSSHFGDVGPPKVNQCSFCDEAFDGPTGMQSWQKKLTHTVLHYKLGHRLAYGRPDFGLHAYMWEKGLVSKAEWKELMASKGTRSQPDWACPSSATSPTRDQSAYAVTVTHARREARREPTAVPRRRPR